MKSNALSATLAVALTALTAVATSHDNGGLPLFNGTTLDGWEGHPALWSVKDGAITGTTTDETKLKHNTFLVWKGGTVDDFELRLKYRIVNGNSGIQYRSKVHEQGAQGPIVGGYQADFEAGKTYSGILYEERGRGILAQRGQKTRLVTDGDKHKVEVTGSVGNSDEIQAKIKAEDWNDYLVIAKGNRLQHFINGVPTVEVVDEDAPRAAKSGVLAFQVHTGPPMVVQFKDIKLKKLGATAGAGGDLEKMQGRWTAAAGSMNGQTIPPEFLESIRLTIEGSKYRSEWQDGSDAGTLAPKPDTSPRHLEISSDTAGQIPAIYEFAGGRMRICYGINGASRPTAFKTEPDSNHLLVEYEVKK
ncbi:MAG: family 16 glycoside hydrolase [Limisphaerales bacterium]